LKHFDKAIRVHFLFGCKRSFRFCDRCFNLFGSCHISFLSSE